MNLSKTDTYNKQITVEWYFLIKWIAIISMVIDHFARMKNFAEVFNLNYELCVIIGRIAFPLFAWELVQHFFFLNTEEQRIKALKRMCLLTFISQPLSDLCGWNGYALNVIGTLTFGWILMVFLEKAELKTEIYKKILYKLIPFIIIAVPFLFFIHCDFNVIGLITILLYYESNKRNNPILYDTISTIIFVFAITFHNSLWYDLDFIDEVKHHIFVIIVPILIYLARKGTDCHLVSKVSKNKVIKLLGRYFFPLHLLILYIIYLIIK